MSKDVIEYYVQCYRPSFEAISKEVQLLKRHFAKNNKVKLHNLHLGHIFRMKFNDRIVSHHFVWYPLFVLLCSWNSKKNRINHIYTSLGDLPYLNVINLRNTILTAAASCSIQKVKKRVPQLKRLKKIIVESKLQQKQLLSLGIAAEKIKVIYPPVDLNLFSYSPANGKFKILYASCPTRAKDFSKRGISLIRDVSKEASKTQFNLLWRGGAYKDIKSLIKNNQNMLVENKIVKDMNSKYAEVHCTIIPYTKFDNYLKLNPNSVIESLAAGKPVLVSDKTEIAQFVEKEKCGVVFTPTKDNLIRAIGELRKNYDTYQKNCRKTAEKYFSKKIFLQEYTKIYDEI